MPTLLTKGNIVPQKWMSVSEKQDGQNKITKDFLIDFISNRVPERRNEHSKIKPKSFGYKVILLKSGTGSGKSTVLPPELYYKFFEKKHKTIVITEPRRLTAESIPEDILKYHSKLKMGVNIGWQTKNISRNSCYFRYMYQNESFLYQ